MRWALLAAGLLLGMGAAHAQVVPQPGAGDPRVQSVRFSADQVVLLQVAQGYQLTIEFAPDEKIETVAVGDSGAWQATPNRRGDRLFVKAVQPGNSSNMVVVTDVRQYVFDLRALPGPTPDMAYSVRFLYTSNEPAAAPDAAADSASMGRYRLGGARRLRPVRMHDDGVRTYLEFRPDGPLPAVYAIDQAGRETLVNGMMRDGVLVIDSIAPSLIFRLDREVARATRMADPERR